MIKVVFENEQYLVLDKPTGLVVNKSKTIDKETLQDQLSSYFALKEGDLGVGDRAGIVHRLDRETSGLLVVAKTNAVFDNLQVQFKNSLVKKEYMALVHGSVKENENSIRVRVGRIGKFGRFGVVDKKVKAGRETETAYKLLDRFKFKDSKFAHLESLVNLSKARENYLEKYGILYSLLAVSPKTGRTHQIRVALKAIGHPVVSDLIYTPGKLLKFDINWCPRLFLHATNLSFTDPVTKKSVSFDSTLPKDLESALSFLTINH